jgi:hypothetical protein
MKTITGFLSAVILLAVTAFSYSKGLEHGSEKADLVSTIVELQKQLTDSVVDRDALANVTAALQSLTQRSN